jgi:hypothetical protein
VVRLAPVFVHAITGVDAKVSPVVDYEARFNMFVGYLKSCLAVVVRSVAASLGTVGEGDYPFFLWK